MQSPQPIPRQVFLSQVTTETEFLQRSKELQAALQSGSFNSYCQTKIQNAKSDAEQDIWKFLLVGIHKCDNRSLSFFFSANFLSPQVNFEDEARIKFLKLLGFSKDDIEKKVPVLRTRFDMSGCFPRLYHNESLVLYRFQNAWARAFIPMDMEWMPKIWQRRCSNSPQRSAAQLSSGNESFVVLWEGGILHFKYF